MAVLVGVLAYTRVTNSAWLGLGFIRRFGSRILHGWAFSFGSVVRLMVDGFGVSDRFDASDDSVER
jgi:hypothetical protein